ncbi:MAG: hypothetical protein KY453_00240 [Gemmatimonadetes bacterium]|nr:hypothetical protein [Gemmatimonadota bacterium]
MEPRPDRRWTSATAERSTRTLFHQIALASFALDRALDSGDGRTEMVREARQALEAFDLLERVTTDVVVPREVRRRVRQAADSLDCDHLELARADLGRAGGELERWWQRGGTRA